MRDYIGSADAYDIFKGNYVSLIKSKLTDNQFVSAAMARGIQLERDIVEQWCSDNGIAEVEGQVQITNEKLPYSHSTLDALAKVKKSQLIIEVKTSKEKAPKDQGALFLKYPKYFYQVQKQMWDSGIKRAVILWCKCPDIESNESPYDEDGRLDITAIYIPYSPDVTKVFATNCPLFWKEWEAAKANNMGAGDPAKLNKLIDMDYYIQQERLVEGLTIQIKEIEARTKSMREEICQAMQKNNIVTYETDAIRISYVAESTKQTVDTARLKSDGLYDKYAKTSVTKPSVRITVKNNG